MLRAIILGLALAVAMTARSAPAAETGDAAIGRVLAKTWCSDCHAIAGTRRSGDTAPAFAALVAGPQGLSDKRLRGWLHDPHPPMKGITLSRQQTEDIVAYLRSLASK